MIGYTNQYLTRNGQPWFPVMGEFHYSRYRPDFWTEELRKMRAGGVSIASTYVFWNHHEELRGTFDFTGCRDIRRFLGAAREVRLPVFLRIGPWVHGEARNGGFPDWLMELGKEVPLRTNDPRYLELVRGWWARLSAQCSGMMWEDGGPVIGIQIENEYGHVGGLRGEEGEAHMRTLTALAKELGFEAPLYTATGWGGAVTGGLLPVFGGYCEAPWEPGVSELPASRNFVFSHVRDIEHTDDPDGDAARWSMYPLLTAELGGGVQVTPHRRPVAAAADAGAMSLVKLGSGAAMLGYYMFHGGSNPAGLRSALHEARATGGYSDLPEINYDFNAPIRQYGTISDTYKEIRLLALFLQDFGADLARMPSEPGSNGADPEDTRTLRLAWRHDRERGYIFVSNYQRRREMEAHPGVTLEGRCEAPVAFPVTDIAPGEYVFFPYHLQLGDAVLESALATPLCALATEQGPVWVFYGDREPQFRWRDNPAHVIHLTRSQALNAAKVRLDQDYLVLAEDFVWGENGRLVVTGGADTMIRTFPPLNAVPHGFRYADREGCFSVYRRTLDSVPAVADLSVQENNGDSASYSIRLTYPQDDIPEGMTRDWLLSVTYAGESMELYQGESKINDYFYTGQPALLSLRYFDCPEHLTAVVHGLREDDRERLFLEQWPEMPQGYVCRIDSVSITEQFRG